MFKKNFAKAVCAAVAAVLAVATVLCIVATPGYQTGSHGASHISKLDNAPAIDLKEYLDSSVTHKLPDTIRDDQQISVIITVASDSLLDVYEQTDGSVPFGQFVAGSAQAAQIRERISEERDQILSALEQQKVSYTLGEEYSTILSGFELLIRAGDFDTVCQSLGEGRGIIVGEEYKVAETKLVENTVNVYDTGIFNSAGAGYDGSGMVVAVLDTGLDSAHSAFSVDNFTSQKLGLTYEDVAAVMGKTTAGKLADGLTVDDVYINEKVPFGFDYADEDPDVYSTHNNHGTHVSGVIVGKDDTITGVAPNAQLVSMKIFSDVMDTARSSWILSALEDCVVLGVDVINMSLGTACGFSRESDEEILNGVYQRIREAGISMVVAASNSYSSAYGSEANGNLGLTSNPDTGTVGSPSTYQGVISVASINGVETPYILHGKTIIYFIESNNGASVENKFCEELLGDQQKVELEYVTVPGVGRSADYTGLDVQGKIALVRRGDTTFEEKALIAEAQGAAGLIIYNNVSGDIKMNVGEAKLPVCSISQDDGEVLAAQGSGKLTFSKDQTSGPFISDFSSWGPTPSLNIKPEITAHGGNILSSVTGGGYDRLSGTSMACPNLAGFVVLLRQYVVENFPDIANDNVAVGAMVNRLMMSTADIVLGTNGLPYAVRKQGAGLANLTSSLQTDAYIVTYDADGKEMDKTKLELGDDPNKTGVYVLKFTVKNFGDKDLSYKLGAYVMTEGVSETKTNAGETTVTEEAYLLTGATVVAAVGDAQLKNGKLTVSSGSSADVTVTITLSDEDKKYLDDSFQNGMYVEGFVTLEATKGTDIDLSVPYLAFYGDWTKAPLFDLDYYETNADELDDSIPVEDKNLADAYASRPIGGLYDDYVSYLGSYYFLQDPKDMIISASRDYIALSNQEGTIHSLRFVWAGLLRNAERIEITITDDTTGEVVFETVDTDVRKSYGDGGSIYPANVEIEFDTMDYNLANNTEYTVRLTGYLDYGDGGLQTNEKNTFEFPLVVDFEAPTLTDVEFYYEYDKNQKKNRLYAKAAVYDNHFTMSAQLGYVTIGTDADGNEAMEMKTFEQYMTPVYSQRNSVTYVTYELTDYIWAIKEEAAKANTFVLTFYDYALNYATYEVGLPNDYVDFYYDGLDEGLTLSPNEVYSLEPLVYPGTQWAELLEFTSSRPSVVRVVNNKLVAASSGNAVIKIRDPQSGKSMTFQVKVLSKEDDGYRRYDKPVADVFRLDGYTTQKAYYMVASEDKLLGDTGDIRFFEGKFDLSMYPSESVKLNYTLDAFFPKDTTVAFESSNESIVKITQEGVVTAEAEGFASVTIKVLQDDRSTYYSETVTVEVKDPYVTTGASLTHYYGKGGVVTIPEKLTLTEIGSFAFSNFEYVLKSEEELAFDDVETSKQWFIGENTITKVVIPEGVEKINSYAFANLTALEEVVLPSTLESIEYGAFYGCTSLQKLTFSGGNNLKIINQHAFENCDLRGSLDLSAVCIISDYAFAGNKKLEGITTSESLISIGQYAFAACKELQTITITAPKVKYGAYAFTDCEALESFYVNAAVLPEGMFYECRQLKSVSIGPDVNEIGEFAFRDTAIEELEILSGNRAYKTGKAAYILSADGKTLVAVAPSFAGSFTAAQLDGAQITKLATGAFSHNTKITSLVLESVTELGDYALASCDNLTSVTLGQLTRIGEYAFFETPITVLPEFTADTVIGRYAFSHTHLQEVAIPDGMTVAEGVFSECMKLQKVTVGNDVTLGKFAFQVSKDRAYTIESRNENGKKLFYYVFATALKELTIGDNVDIGENAFANAASVESVTLGENAKIGKMAFYNTCALKSIDLSKAVSVGDYAFSGDVYYACFDENMAYGAVNSDGYYIYTYHAPALETVDLSAAQSIGEYAFAYCRVMTDVTLGETITRIPQYAFAGCDGLKNINLDHITEVDSYAFIESGLETVHMPAVKTVGEYAFVYCKQLQSVTINPEGTDIGEGAFSYCETLSQVENLNKAEHIDGYAFAYTALTSADLSSAVSLGDHVFLKEQLTPFTVTLGSALQTLGDNPFAMCLVEAFYVDDSQEFNGVTYPGKLMSYEISDTVRVIDGSLYCDIATGMELITFAGDAEKVTLPEGVVRITAMAFAGSDVQMVTLSYTVAAIGHKAFYLCDDLHTVVFNSYDAPILEEEFDQLYYESFEHIPGTGDFGEYTDYDGNQVQIHGMGLIPYYMWNITDGMYSNVFYGANFVDYVGYVDSKLTMVMPVNGQHYETYILNQYFDLRIQGPAAADDVTLAAIAAIKAIPDRVSYEQRYLVEAARAAYAKIATTEQQALVTNYASLVSAEQRITALTPTDEPVEEPAQKTGDGQWFAWVVIALVLSCGIAQIVLVLKKHPQKVKETLAAVKAKLPAKKAKQTPAQDEQTTEE